MSHTTVKGSHIQIKLMPAVAQRLAQDNLLTPITIAKGAPSPEQFNAMLSSGGGNLSLAQAAACTRRLPEVMKELLSLGHQAAIPGLGVFRLIGRGIFDQDGQELPGHELSFSLNFLPNPDFKAFLKTLQAEVVETGVRAPVLRALTDAETASLNTAVTPKSMAKITGKNLRFNALAADEGLFFIPVDGSGLKEMRAVKFLDNRNGRLTFEVPALSAGADYRVEVRKRFVNCKTLRVGLLERTVACG